MSDITFTAKAYCKILLHAAKYPHCAINGVLLSKASTNKSKEIEFVDAVPLFHITINLSPMAEIALMQIDEAVAQKGLIISGYYTALENAKDCSFEKANHRIAEKIASLCSSACLVVVDNSKIGIQLDNIALKVAQYTDNVNYKALELHTICLKPDTVLDICSNLLEKSSHSILVDFDDHLDNVGLDWLNPELNVEIDNLLSIYK